MKISDLAVIITRYEGKKKEVNIAQIKEVLKVLNEILDGQLYKMVRNLKQRCPK